MGPRVGPGPSIHSPPCVHAVRSWTYESRLIKYAKRGYAIAVPGLDWDSVPSKLGGRQAEPAEEPIPEPPSDHYLENPFRINPAYTEWQQQYGTEYHRRSYRSDYEDDGMYEYFEASGLKKLLIANKNSECFNDPNKRTKFVPHSGTTRDVAELIKASGEDYGPALPNVPGEHRPPRQSPLRSLRHV